MNDLLYSFAPNRLISGNAVKVLILLQVATLAIFWAFSPFVFLPTPVEVLHAFSGLWAAGLGVELITSFLLNLQAIALASVISLVLAYLTVVPFFRPIVAAISKLRFLSLVGLTFFFTLAAKNGHELKLYLLVFSVTAFFVTGMADIIGSIPKVQWDLARTMRMSSWRSVFEVAVLGQMDKAWEMLRQNAAIGWMMLTMVEGISRSEGGVGTMLLNQNKHFHLAAVLAIQICILLLGLGQDYALGAIRKLVCPWAVLNLERR